MFEINSYIKQQADIISIRLNELLSNNMNCVVSDAMKYSVSNGGKRIRPFLTIEFARVCGGDISSAIDFGCAVEMIHTYSLIHDDLPCMDNDDMRRGKPSCHIAFGEDNALLAGDALLTEAFKVVSSVKNVKHENVIRAVNELSSSAGINGMVGGQVLDLQFEKTKPNIDEVIKMYSLKTGELLKVSSILGCLSSNYCNNEVIKIATEFSAKIGLAFQIVDDILDVIGDEKTLGKPVGSDDKNDKNTFIKFYGLEKSKEIVEKLTQEAIELLDKLDGDTSVLKQFALMMAQRTF